MASTRIPRLASLTGEKGASFPASIHVRSARTGFHNAARKARLNNAPLVAYAPAQQWRCFSCSSRSKAPAEENIQRRPRESALRVMYSMLKGSFNNLGDVFKARNLRMMYRRHPGETVASAFLLCVLIGGVGSVGWLYYTYFYSKQFTRYPAEVAQSLRRALYYADYGDDTKLALKYFKKALTQCHELGLDPFSDEVMGIKIRLSQYFEKINQYQSAIEVLERTLNDNKRWIDTAAASPALLPRARVVEAAADGAVEVKTKQDMPQQETKEEFESWLRGARSRILAKSVAISTKLGELYSDEHVLQRDKAHERLNWAVETALAELRRRASEGVKSDEPAWLNAEGIGGAMESLAHSYETRSQFDLAVPLFFQALRLCGDQCHMAVIMNNLAVAFAQHPLRAPFETPVAGLPSKGHVQLMAAEVPTRAALLQSAERWAQNAYKQAGEPVGPARTPECDEACAVAMINLADIAAMAGQYDKARQWYEEGIQLSQRFDLVDGVAQARSGIQKLPAR